MYFHIYPKQSVSTFIHGCSELYVGPIYMYVPILSLKVTDHAYSTQCSLKLIRRLSLFIKGECKATIKLVTSNLQVGYNLVKKKVLICFMFDAILYVPNCCKLKHLEASVKYSFGYKLKHLEASVKNSFGYNQIYQVIFVTPSNAISILNYIKNHFWKIVVIERISTPVASREVLGKCCILKWTYHHFFWTTIRTKTTVQTHSFQPVWKYHLGDVETQTPHPYRSTWNSDQPLSFEAVSQSFGSSGGDNNNMKTKRFESPQSKTIEKTVWNH